jgi:carbon-monoxide dehydrogenase large subunit
VRYTREAAEHRLTGQGSFIADLRLRDHVEAAFVRSPLAHARIAAIHVPDGSGLTGRDLADEVRPITIAGPGLRPAPWHPLPADKARYVGEPVAIVYAQDRALAEDLAEHAEVEWEACDEDEPLHDAAIDNVLFDVSGSEGDVDGLFGAAASRHERTWRTARATPLPLECRGAIAEWDRTNGRLTLHSSTQIPDLVRKQVAACLSLDERAIRVVVPEVGGGFGLKAHVFAEEVAVAALARRLGRPVRWIEDRQENLLASAHAHDETVRLRVACDADGRFLAVDAEVAADVGAYSIFPFSASLEPMTTAQTLFGPYVVRAFRFTARGLASSRCPAGAYRGVGMNAAAYATERMVDVIAAELKIDPLELRRRNAVTDFPHRTAAGRELDSGDYLALLDRLEARAGYNELRERQQEARKQGRLFGIGIGFFNEHSGTGAGEYRARGIATIPGNDAARVRVADDGRIEISTSSAEAGQGHPGTYRLLASQELGVPEDRIEVVEGDTDLCPAGTGTFVSRGGVGQLSALVLALREAAERDLEPGLDVVRSVDPRQVYPAGAHLAVAEVDPLSYVPRIVRYVAVEDCGTVVNATAADAQIRGGVAMGIGGVLLEEIPYGEGDQPLAGSLLDYLVPLATDIPEIEIEHLESASPRTELGTKGVGEAGTIGAFAAVANAVADAVAPLGAEVSDLPYSPNRIYEEVTRSRQ